MTRDALAVIKTFLCSNDLASEKLAADALADLFEEAGDADFANALRNHDFHAWLLHPTDFDTLPDDPARDVAERELRRNRHSFRCPRDVRLYRSTMNEAYDWFGRDDGMLVADTIQEAVDYLMEENA